MPNLLNFLLLKKFRKVPSFDAISNIEAFVLDIFFLLG